MASPDTTFIVSNAVLMGILVLLLLSQTQLDSCFMDSKDLQYPSTNSQSPATLQKIFVVFYEAISHVNS